MFSGCKNLEIINLKFKNIEGELNIDKMFYNCDKLSQIYFSTNNNKIQNMKDMFKKCSKLQNINLDKIDISLITDLRGMFKDFSSLNTIRFNSLRTNENMMDALIDAFGKDFRVIPDGESDITVNLKCNPDAFFYWAMQYGQHIEVLEPESMRVRIKKAVLDIQKKYRDADIKVGC